MNWKGVVIHHSASPDVSANTIDSWHRQRGFKEIGYHFVIRANGDIEPARDFRTAGAHALGRNSTHLGICVVGDFTKHAPTEEQIDSLIRLCRGIKSRFGIEKWERHHENCPGPLFPWDRVMDSLK